MVLKHHVRILWYGSDAVLWNESGTSKDIIPRLLGMIQENCWRITNYRYTPEYFQKKGEKTGKLILLYHDITIQTIFEWEREKNGTSPFITAT